MKIEDILKICTKCKSSLPATSNYFYKNKRSKSKLNSWCKKCSISKTPEQSIARNKRNYEFRTYRVSEYKESSWEPMHMKNSDGTKFQYSDYLILLDKQHDRCAVCGSNDKGRGGKYSEAKHFQVDHNHITGIVRGLLCYRCNMAAGLLKADQDTRNIESLLNYISGLSLISTSET